MVIIYQNLFNVFQIFISDGRAETAGSAINFHMFVAF